MNIVYIALGSNLGDRKYYLTRAVDEIEKRIGEIFLYPLFMKPNLGVLFPDIPF